MSMFLSINSRHDLYSSISSAWSMSDIVPPQVDVHVQEIGGVPKTYIVTDAPGAIDI
jgi:hypothetical protein